MAGKKLLELEQFLKIHSWVASGGEAKARIQAGEVKVNGEEERRRSRKLRAGDIVEMGGRQCAVKLE